METFRTIRANGGLRVVPIFQGRGIAGFQKRSRRYSLSESAVTLATLPPNRKTEADLTLPAVPGANYIGIDRVSSTSNPIVSSTPLIVVRAAADSPEASELMRRLTEELAARYDYLDDGTGNFRPEDVQNDRAVFLIGRIGDVAVACAALKPVSGRVGELKRVFVARSCRGRGYGRELLREIEHLAVEFGYDTLRLETGTRQPESLRLYETSGYRRIPNYEPYVDSDWSVCFEKTLAAAT